MLWILERYCSGLPFLDEVLLVKEGCPHKVERVWPGRGHRDLGSDPTYLGGSGQATVLH